VACLVAAAFPLRRDWNTSPLEVKAQTRAVKEWSSVQDYVVLEELETGASVMQWFANRFVDPEACPEYFRQRYWYVRFVDHARLLGCWC
jgi:hypothetical protein